MELLTNVDWTAVIVGAVVAYVLGAVWYSDKMFAKKWMEGKGTPAVPNTPMAYGMIAQAFATFFLAWLVGVGQALGSVWFSLLVAATAGSLIKANGFFGGKTKYAIAVEATYVLAMVIIMLLVHEII